ncbi:MAG: hypothetical protein V4623_09535, partial [Pseudomonadota bacterium]
MSTTRLNFLATQRKKSTRGFALISAILLLVVLAALAGFVISVSTTQSRSQALDIQNAQAQQAARAGLEWIAYQINKNGQAGSLCNNTSQTPGVLPGLEAFTLNVVCQGSS